MSDPSNRSSQPPRTTGSRSLFDATDEIEAYYSNPLMRPDQVDDVDDRLQRRIDESLTRRPRNDAPDTGHDPRSRRSMLFALLCLAVGVLVSIVVLTGSVERERELVERTTLFYSTEARILEELRRETAEELRRKDEEIARYLVTLRRLDEQRATLERELNGAISQEQDLTERRIADAVAAERERLSLLGLSEREKATRIFRFQIDVEQRYTDELELFIAEQTSLFRLRQATLFSERETAQQLLATATRERDDLRVAYRGIATTPHDEGPESHGEALQESVLHRFQESALLETLFRSQVRERLEIVTAAILLGRLDEAREAIAGAREFLENDTRLDQHAGIAEIQFATRALDSFQILLDSASPAEETGVSRRLRDESFLEAFDLPLESRRTTVLSDALAGTQIEARQARAQALDTVDAILQQLADGDPASRELVMERVAEIEGDDPQLAGVLVGIVAALNAAASFEREPLDRAEPAVLIGTVALVQPGLITVERVALAAVTPGDRLIVRRSPSSGGQITVATARVERVRGGFIDARVEQLTESTDGVRLLDRVYLTSDPPPSHTDLAP